MTELSSAAQAVLDAYETTIGYRQGFAAVICTVADLVVPFEPLHGGDERWMLERDTRQICRRKLLAIAAELEDR